MRQGKPCRMLRLMTLAKRFGLASLLGGGDTGLPEVPDPLCDLLPILC